MLPETVIWPGLDSDTNTLDTTPLRKPTQLTIQTCIITFIHIDAYMYMYLQAHVLVQYPYSANVDMYIELKNTVYNCTHEHSKS